MQKPFISHSQTKTVIGLYVTTVQKGGVFLTSIALTSHPGTLAALRELMFQSPSSNCRCERWRWRWRPHTTADPWRSKLLAEQPPKTDPDGNLPLSGTDKNKVRGNVCVCSGSKQSTAADTGRPKTLQTAHLWFVCRIRQKNQSDAPSFIV